MAKWWEIEMAIQDATTNVDYARSAIAGFFVGDEEPIEDPDMDLFLKRLDEVHKLLREIYPDGIKRAIKEEAERDDEMEALADAASY